jgi:glutaredoxin
MDGMNRDIGVRLLTLSDCGACMWLKSELDEAGIAYVTIDYDTFKQFGDEVMDKFHTEMFPMVFIDLGPNVITVVGKTDLELSTTLRIFNSIPELAGIIKSYIK